MSKIVLPDDVSDVYDPKTGTFSSRQNRAVTLIPDQIVDFTYRGRQLQLCVFDSTKLTVRWRRNLPGRILAWAITPNAYVEGDCSYDAGEILFVLETGPDNISYSQRVDLTGEFDGFLLPEGERDEFFNAFRVHQGQMTWLMVARVRGSYGFEGDEHSIEITVTQD